MCNICLLPKNLYKPKPWKFYTDCSFQQAGWKETHSEFANKLKNLTAHGVTEVGPALKNALDMLNMNRNQSGIDTYGQVSIKQYLTLSSYPH